MHVVPPVGLLLGYRETYEERLARRFVSHYSILLLEKELCYARAAGWEPFPALREHAKGRG